MISECVACKAQDFEPWFTFAERPLRATTCGPQVHSWSKCWIPCSEFWAHAALNDSTSNDSSPTMHSRSNGNEYHKRCLLNKNIDLFIYSFSFLAPDNNHRDFNNNPHDYSVPTVLRNNKKKWYVSRRRARESASFASFWKIKKNSATLFASRAERAGPACGSRGTVPGGLKTAGADRRPVLHAAPACRKVFVWDFKKRK